MEKKLRAEKEREELIARLEKEKGEAIELEDYTKAKGSLLLHVNHKPTAHWKLEATP